MSHAAWVTERLAALPSPTPFTDGALVRLYGVDHRISHVGGRGGVRAVGREILVGGQPDLVADRVAAFLRAEALRRFSALVAEKSAAADVRPSKVVVKDTRSRWGSCAANRCLAFSWRLVMAPRFIQDYVAAHEVAHLRHMNHSPKFWSLVEQLSPYTEQAMVWLRSEGPRLLRVG